MKKQKLLSLLLCLLSVLLLLFSCGTEKKPEASSSGTEISFAESVPDEESSREPVAEGALLKIHYIDVGQGDSEFIELPDGKCMLIDAGDQSHGETVRLFISSLGYTRIDYLVATHPHADHIGGMKLIVESFDIGQVFMPNVTTDTKLFLALLTAIDTKGLSISEAKAGRTITKGDSFSADIIAPSVIVEDDLNNCSAVIMLTYGERSFLFMGDAGIDEENTITAGVKCDVVKVGHHGSRTSSGEKFVARTENTTAVISCGLGNDYGHPHEEALNRWISGGVTTFYRTDLEGTVSLVCDGSTIEKAPDGTDEKEYKWVLNTGSKKIHRPDCKAVADMAESNREYSSLTIAELEKAGYTCCGICKPED